MEFLQNNKFLKIFITASIIFFILFCLLTTYLFLQNQKLKNQIIEKIQPILTITPITEEININGTQVKCGGWDTSGEIICDCQGTITKSVCPSGAVCDSGDYFCRGSCGSCCYKGVFDNPAYPKCP